MKTKTRVKTITNELKDSDNKMIYIVIPKVL